MIEKVITKISIDLCGDTLFYKVSAKQFDKNSRCLMITLMNDGSIYNIPQDSIAIINVKKPDGKFVYNQCVIKNNVIEATMTNQMLAAAGTAYADINIKTADASQLISSASFTIEIEQSMRNENAIVSSNEMTIIDQKIFEIEKNEVTRRSNETTRVIQEKVRVANENKRITSEEERAKAENKRQTDTSTAVSSADTATRNAQEATRNAIDVTARAENALYSQTQLEQTLNQVVDMKQNVAQDKTIVLNAKEDVLNESEKIKETIAQASVETAKEVLDAINAVADEIKDQYGTLSITADGGTPTSVDYLTIDGGTPMSTDSLKLDAGSPFSI